MLLPPKPRGITGSGARSCLSVACQPAMLELPTHTMPPGGGVSLSSAASDARIAFSKRAGSGYCLIGSGAAAAVGLTSAPRAATGTRDRQRVTAQVIDRLRLLTRRAPRADEIVYSEGAWALLSRHA